MPFLISDIQPYQISKWRTWPRQLTLCATNEWLHIRTHISIYVAYMHIRTHISIYEAYIHIRTHISIHVCVYLAAAVDVVGHERVAGKLPVEGHHPCREREFFMDNLLVRIHFIIVMIWWTGLAPWEFEFPFPGSLTSTLRHERVARQLPVEGHHPCSGSEAGSYLRLIDS